MANGNGGGVSDFLFEGRPPQSVTTYGQTVENVPKWLSDYTQGLLARANVVAGEPYQPYGGPRIAGFDPLQEAGFEAGEQAAGAYHPYLEQAGTAMTGALEQAQAGFPGNVEQYMNPYIENVLNRQEGLATRTLEEKFLPALQQTFGGAGQYGSRGGEGSMETTGVRGVRDIMENLEQQRLATLGGAYGEAADIYGADIGRQFEGAEQMGALGETAQQLGFREAAGLGEVGGMRRAMPQASLDLAYQDFQRQQAYPGQQTAFMSEMIRGLPSQGGVTTQTDVGPADVYGPSGLAQLGAAGTGLAALEELIGARGGLARVSGYKRKVKSPQFHLEYS